MMGYGAHRQSQRKGLFGVADDQPVPVIAIDSEARIRAAGNAIRHMVTEGLITISDVEVILQAGSDTKLGGPGAR